MHHHQEEGRKQALHASRYHLGPCNQARKCDGPSGVANELSLAEVVLSTRSMASTQYVSTSHRHTNKQTQTPGAKQGHRVSAMHNVLQGLACRLRLGPTKPLPVQHLNELLVCLRTSVTTACATEHDQETGELPEPNSLPRLLPMLTAPQIPQVVNHIHNQNPKGTGRCSCALALHTLTIAC